MILGIYILVAEIRQKNLKRIEQEKRIFERKGQDGVGFGKIYPIPIFPQEESFECCEISSKSGDPCENSAVVIFVLFNEYCRELKSFSCCNSCRKDGMARARNFAKENSITLESSGIILESSLKYQCLSYSCCMSYDFGILCGNKPTTRFRLLVFGEEIGVAECCDLCRDRAFRILEQEAEDQNISLVFDT